MVVIEGGGGAHPALDCEGFALQRRSFRINTWVDRAHAASGVRLTDLERRQLTAAMLVCRYLILSGPAGSGKRQLAYALALSIVGDQQDHVRLIQGHPWWAASAGDVARYVGLQTEFNRWRLADFLRFALDGRQPLSGGQAKRNAGDFVVCVERMSPMEIDFYFRALSPWLREGTLDQAESASLRLIGTYDSDRLPDLDDRIQRAAALVHLGSAMKVDDHMEYG